MVSESQVWYRGVVIKGFQEGGKFSYPTLNFEPSLLPADQARGVYAAWVKIGEKRYQGALYFGPRLVKGEEADVLEVYVLGLDQDLYGQQVSFSLAEFIRPAENFDSFEELKKRVTQDIKKVKQVLKKEK